MKDASLKELDDALGGVVSEILEDEDFKAAQVECATMSYMSDNANAIRRIILHFGCFRRGSLPLAAAQSAGFTCPLSIHRDTDPQ